MPSSERTESPLLAGYQPAPGVIDETHAADGGTGSPWRYVIEGLSALGPEGLSERQIKARRILRDDGATYNVYNDDNGQRTWPLDLVPWLIDSGEWSLIERGLQERAELFNLLLQDLYGERELIRRGILPPELVFGHPGYLRPCSGLPAQNRRLIMHAADMVRGPDGRMCVVSDRAQAPSGAGYALENRSVLSRVLPSLFRDSHVHRLATFFQQFRQTLVALAPGVASPNIVMLTPGVLNETYFEHAYLANYLGFSLVQGSDLLVRDGYVWMKSLAGRRRVDVIVRRVDDTFCDPVELRGDSQLGIPGLLNVVRAGRVAVANPLGSGVLESPALLRFLPAISQHFLGRSLRLDSVATWWCGLPEDLEYVAANFDSLVIKPVTRLSDRSSVIVAELSAAERASLLQDIRANPAGFVAQEKLMPSHLPVFENQQLLPRPVLLRTFAVASGDSYRLMPGGLTRTGLREQNPLISNQLGATSKDTWVLASEPEKQAELWPQSPYQEKISESSSLPSRVAENIFWLGRHAERGENLLRFLRAVFLRLNSATGLGPYTRDALLECVSTFTFSAPGFVDNPTLRESPEPELRAVLFDTGRSGSVASVLQGLVECAESSRDLLSADGQRVVNDVTDQRMDLEELLEDRTVFPEDALNPLITSLLALSGVVEASMLKSHAWRFFDTGRRIERVLQTINLLRGLLAHGDGDITRTETLLQSIEGLSAYRRLYPGPLTVRNVLALVLLEDDNPRSVIYQLERLSEHLDALPVEDDSVELEAEKRCLMDAWSQVKMCRLSTLSGDDPEQSEHETRVLMNHVYGCLTELADLLAKRFFAPTETATQLTAQPWVSR